MTRESRLLAVSPLLFMLCGIGLTSTGLIPGMYGWVLMALGALFGLAASLYILFARIRKGQSHFRMLAIIAALPVAVAAPILVHDLSYPLINDVTTDLESPPAFAAALEAPANAGRDMAYPERFVPIVREAYPDVRPLVLDESSEQVLQRVAKLAETQSGWEIRNIDSEKQTVEGEVSTRFLGFIDDFVIRVSNQDGKTRVDMRSKSRDGLVDAGANANRIRSFLAELAGE